MWNFSKSNGGYVGAQTRQYCTMPGPLLNKTLPAPVNFLSGVCTNFDYMHKISTQKRFVNPNFVNPQNPNLHNCQPAVNTLVEKCSVFLADTHSCPKQNTPETQKHTESAPSNTCEEEISEMKENSKRKKTMNRRSNSTKKTTKHSLSSPRKSNKGRTKSLFNLKYEVDEIGLDPLSDSYDSDMCSSPMIDVSSSPLPSMEQNVPCFGYSDLCISIAAIPESKPKSTVVISIDKPKISDCHSRIPSDCGSEDSFVVFQCSSDDVSDVSEEELDTGTESDEDEDSDDSSCSESNFEFKTEDVVDFSSRATHKRVRFADDLFVVHPMCCWSYAYRKARKGPWEEYALDRTRFKDRVRGLENILNPVLQPNHRQKIFDERFNRTEN